VTQSSSPKKRQANRRNALHSTGPRTDEGKRRSAVNAIRHGLSTAGQWIQDDPRGRAIADYIEQEGIEPGAAQELAQRIVSYELNLAHQRRLFLQSRKEPGQDVDQTFRGMFGRELEMLDDTLLEQQVFDGKINKKDLKFVIKSKLKMFKLAAKVNRQQSRANALEAQSSLRYFKRSSNQLSKGLKALKPEA
jgi:hypothetical protein